VRSLSLAQYARFLVVGTIAGLFSIACRELFGYLLGADDPRHYSISVALAYAAGIVVSFVLNQRFTFLKDKAERSWSKFIPFVAVAMAGLVCTWLISIALRYGLPLTALIGKSSASVAFAAATVLASLITYPLNGLFVFGKKSSATNAMRDTVATSRAGRA
jgi:putative flippase GtrA